MRLAVFTSQFPCKVSTFFARDIRGLIESGIEVDIFPIYNLDPSLWKYVPEMLNEEILPRERIHHISLCQGMFETPRLTFRQMAQLTGEYARISSSALHHGFMAWAKSSYVLPKAAAWARQYAGEYDHILAYWGNYAGTAAYLFHQLSHNHVPFSIYLHAGTDLYRTPVYMREKLLYSDNIITCIEFNRKFILENFQDISSQIQDRIVVNYHGMDMAEFPLQLIKEKHHTVIGVGSLASKKGFSYLIQAIGALNAMGVNVNCELVGDGNEEGYLRELAARLNIADKVIFHGWKPFAQVKEHIRNATILVHPSTELGDGLPNVIKEAMALGTPVIASNIAGIPEGLAFGECGRLVPPKNHQVLAREIQSLLGDEEMRLQLAKRARKHAQKTFDMWKNGNELAEILKSTRRNSTVGKQCATARELVPASS